MNWKFYPTNKELMTSLPMSVTLENYSGKPTVTLSSIGELQLVKVKDGTLRADFYVLMPGNYIIEMKDANSQFSHQFAVKQYSYLSFTNEFGFFLIIFIFFMGGIILWTKKIMKKPIRKT